MTIETAPPLWLMDVDGVLNAWYAKQHHTVFRAGNGFNIAYEKHVLDAILPLHTSGAVEIRWLTTWGDEANTHLSTPFGWPTFTVAGTRPLSSPYEARDCGEDTYTWWKATVAERLYNDDHRLIWADDELADAAGLIDWVQDADPDRLLLLGPDRHVGLTLEDVEKVKAWL